MGAKRIASLFSTALLLCASLSFSNAALAENLPTDKQCKKVENPSDELKGWCLAINRKEGNCLACHTIVTDQWPEGFGEGGNTGPPLVAMQARFPDRDKLTAQIYDSTTKNPNSLMPPFGAHGILSDEQIDKIVTFLMTL